MRGLRYVLFVFVLLLALPAMAQQLPDAPQPSFKHDLLMVTLVNMPHLASLALDAQSTNVDVNFAKCCYEEHDFLYGRYPSLGRLSGVMAVEYGMNEAYTVWMWRLAKNQPKWTRRLLTFAPGYTMAAMHIWAGTHNQFICINGTTGNHNCSLLQHK